MTLPPLGIDPTWVVALAAVTLLDGVRRLPAGRTLFRAGIDGRWRPLESGDRERLRIVSWWSPITLTVVTDPCIAAASTAGDPSPAERLRSIRVILTLLRVLGAATLFLLVVGVPGAAGTFGFPGFTAAVALLLLLAGATAVVHAVGLRRIGAARSVVLRQAPAALWPFNAPSSAERLLSMTLSGASPYAVARLLLDESTFARWVRPMAYDALHSAASDAALEAELSREELTRIVQQIPASQTASAACLRCGATWLLDSGTCSECGVPLSRVAETPA